jgi:putative transcriptional regulator
VNTSVANRLRELRQRYGLTQEQLARDLDVTRHTILALEVGRYVPSIELALRLAAYFDQPLESIFWLPDEELADVRGLVRQYKQQDQGAGVDGKEPAHG